MRSVALFWLAFFATAMPAAAFPAHILRCHDGDTCTAETGQGTLRIRLVKIDAPEIDQPYALEAGDTLCSIICGRDVDVEPRGTSYDRVVGLIQINGIGTSEAMIKAGAAWDYPQYGHDLAMPTLQAKARAGRLGLWADPAAVPSWTWCHIGIGRFRSP